MNVNTYMVIRRFEDVMKCKCKSTDNRGLFTFIVQYIFRHIDYRPVYYSAEVSRRDIPEKSNCAYPYI